MKPLWVFCVFVAVVLSSSDAADEELLKADTILSKYYSNYELTTFLQAYNQQCSNISRVFSVGKSASGNPLLVLEISDRAGKVEAKPNFKYIGNIHGDEPSGRQLLLMLARWLCDNVATNSTARALVQDMHLFLMPTANPDGFEKKARSNMARKDLNRDFPDPTRHHCVTQGTEQPETQALMSLAMQTRFTASAALHEGAVVANYPWDGYGDVGMQAHGKNSTQDDDTFVHLAKTYAQAHAFMAQSKDFPDGITNGAAWYPVYGGMQDWNYVAAHCMELTLELSESKWPPPDTLPQLWRDNMDALLRLPRVAALGGVHGFVFDAGNKLAGKTHAHAPLMAEVRVQGSDWAVRSGAQYGEYFRPLAPGRHTVSISCPGYSPEQQEVVVPEDGSGALLNFMLKKLSDGGDEQEGGADAAASAAGGDATGKQQAELVQARPQDETSPDKAPSVVLPGGSSGSSGGAAAGVKQHGHLTGASQVFTQGWGLSIGILAVFIAAVVVVACRYSSALSGPGSVTGGTGMVRMAGRSRSPALPVSLPGASRLSRPGPDDEWD